MLELFEDFCSGWGDEYDYFVKVFRFKVFLFFFTPHTVYCCICTEPSNKAAMCYLKLWSSFSFFLSSVLPRCMLSFCLWTLINITGKPSNQRTTGKLNRLILHTEKTLIHSFLLLWLLSALLMFRMAQYCLLWSVLYLFSIYCHCSLPFDEVLGSMSWSFSTRANVFMSVLF